MNAYARGKKGNRTISVPTLDGPVLRSTGTPDADTAADYGAMVQALARKARWWALQAIADDRIKLKTLYAHYVADTLDALKEALEDVDLATHFPGWVKWQHAHNRTDSREPEENLRRVRTLLGLGAADRFPRSALTKGRVAQAVAALDVATATRRHYFYALSSFVRYLLEIDVLEANPIAGVRRPKKGPRRRRWEPLPVCRTIVDAHAEPYRTLSALIHATGAELSAALAMRLADLDLDLAECHVPGTKHVAGRVNKRDRYHVQIERWALSDLRRHIKARGLMGTVPLFAGMNRDTAHRQHVDACTAVGVQDYTIHDARHSWAVRHIQAGASWEAVADQLGNTPWEAKNTYGDWVRGPEEKRRDRIDFDDEGKPLVAAR